MKIGYARVSSTDQNTALQEEALKANGCERVYSEKMSGASIDGRAELETILNFVRAGDVLVVIRLDRLARSLSDMITIATRLKDAGAALKVIEQPIDTTTAEGRLFFHMLGAFAQFETELRKNRQTEGIARAKVNGRYENCGRPETIDRVEVAKFKATGLGASEIAREMGISRASVYRVLNGATP